MSQNSQIAKKRLRTISRASVWQFVHGVIFNLVQYYAKPYRNGQDNSQPGVPYRTSPEIEPMARNTVEEVYTKIHGDLDEALNLLADYEPNDKNHYSLASVYGLKARALLTQQKYADAATAAVNSINEAEKDGCKIMSQSELMNGFANITSATKEAMYAAMTQNDQTVLFLLFLCVYVLELQLQLYPHRYQMYQPKVLTT